MSGSIGANLRDANFHTAEYELLYAEIGQNFRLAFQVAVYALSANGFIIAWVAQAGKDVFSPVVIEIASVIPVLLTLFAFTLYRFLLWRSATIYNYLFDIEQKVAIDGLGWEHFLSSIGPQRPQGDCFARDFLCALRLAIFAGGCIRLCGDPKISSFLTT